MIHRSYLTTRDCAAFLEVSQEYIRGEIDDGRLKADVQRKTKYGRRPRRLIRIDREEFRKYCAAHWPSAVPRWPAA